MGMSSGMVSSTGKRLMGSLMGWPMSYVHVQRHDWQCGPAGDGTVDVIWACPMAWLAVLAGV